MDRDELIVSCTDIVNNLVKKYNNHKIDEDLVSEGMIAVVECVDRCLKENMTDVKQIQARCNVWARNRILDNIYREKIKYVDNEEALEFHSAQESLWEYIESIRQILTPKQKEVFDLLLRGYKEKEIENKLNIKQSMYFEHVKNIKEKIKSGVFND